VLNAYDGSTITTVPVGNDPRGVSVSPDGSRVYVSNYADGTISVIETPGYTVVTTIAVGAAPGHVVISPDGALGFVVRTQSTGVYRLDLLANTAQLLYSDDIHSLAWHPDGSGAFGSVKSLGDIRIFPNHGGPVEPFAAAASANGPIAVTPDGLYLWTIHNGTGTARRLSTFDGSDTGSLGDLGFLTVADTTGPIMGPTIINGSLSSIGSDAALTTLGFDGLWLPFANGDLTLSGSFTSEPAAMCRSWPTNRSARASTRRSRSPSNGRCIGTPTASAGPPAPTPRPLACRSSRHAHYPPQAQKCAICVFLSTPHHTCTTSPPAWRRPHLPS
jgi:YVTN family beta-propeller protein